MSSDSTRYSHAFQQINIETTTGHHATLADLAGVVRCLPSAKATTLIWRTDQQIHLQSTGHEQQKHINEFSIEGRSRCDAAKGERWMTTLKAIQCLQVQWSSFYPAKLREFFLYGFITLAMGSGTWLGAGHGCSHFTRWIWCVEIRHWHVMMTDTFDSQIVCCGKNRSEKNNFVFPLLVAPYQKDTKKDNLSRSVEWFQFFLNLLIDISIGRSDHIGIWYPYAYYATNIFP